MRSPSFSPSGTSDAGVQEHSQSGDSPTSDVFTSVVERHSPMVLGVCRRMLTDANAEDAAQAVFILFWQKAMGLCNETQIAGWLHRTAQHVCRNARRSSVLRSRHEQKAAAESPTMSPEAADPVQWKEIREILDEEVNRLPEKLRIAFVLFHCENRSLTEMSHQLGASVSTVGTWLQRSRENLAVRLKRRGIVVSAAALGTILSQQIIAEAAPVAFVAATIQTVADVSAAGLTACSPVVASLVKAGIAGGLSKSLLIASVLVAGAISFPVVVVWLLPDLQTRRSADFPLLQGEWRQVAHEQHGGPVNALPKIELEDLLQISSRGFHRKQILADGGVLKGESGSFTLDNSQSPATIDFHMSQGTARGIYQLDGNTLTICVTQDGGSRPTELATKQNDGRILSRYQRVR